MLPNHRAAGPALLFLALFGGLAVLVPQAAEPAAKLSEDDRKFLGGLVKEFLFNPTGAQRVQVATTRRTVWAGSAEVIREGWLVVPEDGTPGRVYFTDGESIPVPAKPKPKPVDFVAACRKRYTEKKPAKGEGPERDDRFGRMRERAIGVGAESDLALAAWLYWLGHEELAARALAQARKGEGDPRKELRKELAWSAYAAMVHAYMVRADEEALAHGQRLVRLYPEAAKEHGQGEAVVAELKRRQKAGTFGKAPAAGWPDGFDKWEVKKKVAYLIAALDEVDARQWGQPGGIDLASDRRVKALIQVGDPAVPALIDAVEKDDRLTRSVHFWRDFASNRTVLGVREAALTAVMSILRIGVFEPASTGDNFTARGEQGVKQTVARLRSYWKEYGQLPFDERMMKVLTNPKATGEALREAAGNLARLGEERALGTTVWSGWRRPQPNRPNPAVAKFRNPTAAAAILAAMDCDLAAHDAGRRDRMHDYYRRQIEDAYLFPLIDLGDQRAAAVCAERSGAATTARLRRKWALAAHRLGDPKPMRAFAEDFRAGRVKLPGNDQPQTNDDDQPGNVELRETVGYLTGIGTPEADRALFALADKDHPLHALTVKQVLGTNPQRSDNASWFAHPFCLRILRQALDDPKPTGAILKIEGNSLRRVVERGWSGGPIPELLADPAVRKDEAPERACDKAAEKVCELVLGQPAYHPLFKDADRRLANLRKSLDRFPDYRRLSYEEARLLGGTPWHPVFVPDLRPLGRAATAADVKAGRAIFHLDGKGKPAGLKLPAVAVRHKDKVQQHPPHVLIVQAEVGPDGEVTYGVIAKDGIRTHAAVELGPATSLDDWRKQQRPAGSDEDK